MAAKKYFIWKDGEMVKKGFNGVNLQRDVFITEDEAFNMLEEVNPLKTKQKNIEKYRVDKNKAFECYSQNSGKKGRAPRL